MWPRLALVDTVFDLKLPVLSFLLGRGSRAWGNAQDAADWLATCVGLAAPMPAAPVRLLGCGGEPGTHTWLCLDPVHLHLEKSRIALDDPAQLKLSADEAHALVQDLAPLLNELGELQPSAPQYWHLRLHAADSLNTLALTALSSAIGRSAESLMNGDKRWLQRQNEIQMLLHEHPINQAREAQGKPAINSLWPWGLGKLPALPRPTAPPSLFGNGPLLQGIAQLLNTPLQPMPEAYSADYTDAFIHLNLLESPAQRLDAMHWREALTEMENHWLAPALAALQQGKLQELILCGQGAEATLTLCCTRGDLWRIWRRPLPLHALGGTQ